MTVQVHLQKFCSNVLFKSNVCVSTLYVLRTITLIEHSIAVHRHTCTMVTHMMLQDHTELSSHLLESIANTVIKFFF